MNNNKNEDKGLSLYDLLTVAFVMLKLQGHINWSWWWVLSPFWISIVIRVVINLLKLKDRKDV
jgi:hypothetical protein